MRHLFEHPKAAVLLNRVSHFFHSDDIYILPHTCRLIFVCGGPMNKKKMRPQFCEYAKEHLSHLCVFLAEEALDDYWQHQETEFQNVARFEEIIAELSSCVILFPESPGSFAELGYFASIKTLRKKLLVVNNVCYQSTDSFITLGPINLVDRHSRFQPTVQLAYSEDPEFKHVKARLDKRIPPQKNRKKFKAKKYGQLSIHHKLYTVFEIVRIFRVLTVEGVVLAFKKIWGNAKRAELHRLLSILVAANYIKRGGLESNYYCINLHSRSFLEFERHDVETVIMEIIDLYEKDFDEPAQIIQDLKG